MKVINERYAIITDEDTSTYIGGAALVNETIKEELIKSGNMCDILLYNGESKPEDIKDSWYEYDFYILANIGYLPYEFLNKIIDEKKFITFRHDIPIVLYTRPRSMLFQEFYKTWQKMFTNALMTFFISHMQAAIFSQHFKFNEYTVLPPPADLTGFKNENKEDRNGCLYVGDINQARGCDMTLGLMKQNWPGSRYTFVGKVTDEGMREYLEKNGATVIDEVPHKEIAKYMNDYKHFLYFPKIYDSFCLKIIEAELCGMTIYADKMCIGRFSYDKTLESLAASITENSMKKIIFALTKHRKSNDKV